MLNLKVHFLLKPENSGRTLQLSHLISCVDLHWTTVACCQFRCLMTRVLHCYVAAAAAPPVSTVKQVLFASLFLYYWGIFRYEKDATTDLGLFNDEYI